MEKKDLVDENNLILQPEKLNFTTKLAYGAGDMGPAITANILVFFLLPFFTNVAGLSPDIAGSILMIGKIGDAINDPIVGILSDRTKTRWGRRLPWILWGAIPFGLTFFLQWLVPNFSEEPEVNLWLLFSYYVVIAIFFNIAYTAVNLPYTALTPELTRDYNERTNLNSFRFAFSIGGSILSLILAFLVFENYPSDQEQQFLILGGFCAILAVIPILWCALSIQERGYQPILNRRQKRFVGLFLLGCALLVGIYSFFQLVTDSSLNNVFNIFNLIATIVLILFAICLLFGKTESHLLADNRVVNQPEVREDDQIPFFQQIKIVFSNKPFLFVIGIYLCSWLAVQLTASIIVYFVVSWMGLSNSDSPLLALAVQGTALIMLFAWQKVSLRLGKKAVYFIGTGIWMLAQIGFFLIQPGQVTLMYILAILAGFGVSVAYLIPWSMVPDVIELDELNTGKRREGIFYGFMVLLQKFGLALGLFLVGIALKAAGFVESVAGQPIPEQPESALLAIRIAISPLPAFFLLCGLVLAYFYPITQEVHGAIRLKLQARKDSDF